MAAAREEGKEGAFFMKAVMSGIFNGVVSCATNPVAELRKGENQLCVRKSLAAMSRDGTELGSALVTR